MLARAERQGTCPFIRRIFLLQNFLGGGGRLGGVQFARQIEQERAQSWRLAQRTIGVELDALACRRVLAGGGELADRARRLLLWEGRKPLSQPLDGQGPVRRVRCGNNGSARFGQSPGLRHGLLGQCVAGAGRCVVRYGIIPPTAGAARSRMD